MIVRLPNQKIDVFTISPRTLDKLLYWHNIQNVICWSEQYDCTGILIFTGNDVYVDPWIVAHTVFSKTQKLCPLVAVNPIYMHPFSVAKMISSFAYLYKRKVFLNMVTGTALSYLEGLNENLSHEKRYDRLLEYIKIIQSLIADVGLTSFHGNFYKVSNLKLLPELPKSLSPTFLVAGQSEAAKKVSHLTNAIGMQMLSPKLEQELNEAKGIHFGILTREDEKKAWQAAHSLFPEDKEGQEILNLSMSNTDSVWKKKIKLISEIKNIENPNYWTVPFLNFQADCPYYIGSYEQVSNLVVSLIQKGIRTFILDIPAIEEEFYHIDIAFKIAAQKLMAENAIISN